MYDYRVKVIEVVDANILDVLVDQGLDCSLRIWVGLYRISPLGYMHKEDKKKAIEVQDYLEKRLIKRNDIVIKTFKNNRSNEEKQGSFNKYLAEIYIGGISINTEMINKGLVDEYTCNL